MNINELSTFISTLGFPIACTCAMGVILYKFSNIFLQLSVTLKGIETRLENIETKLLKEEK